MKRMQPVERCLDRSHGVHRRQSRTRHQDDRQRHPPRRFDLGVGGSGAGIFAHDELDLLALEERALGVELERTSLSEHVRAGQVRNERVYGSDQVIVLWCRVKGGELQPTDAEEYTPGPYTERSGRSGHARHVRPAVARHLLPSRAFEAYERHTRDASRRFRMRRHLRREWVRGVDQCLATLSFEVTDEAVDSAKASDAVGHPGVDQTLRTPRKGQDRRISSIFRQVLCASPPLICPAED